MTHDRLIVRGDPTAPFFHLYAYKDGERQEWVGVLFEDLPETIIGFLKKYELTNVDLSGPHSYLKGVEHSVRNTLVQDYNECLDVTFRYV